MFLQQQEETYAEIGSTCAASLAHSSATSHQNQLKWHKLNSNSGLVTFITKQLTNGVLLLRFHSHAHTTLC